MNAYLGPATFALFAWWFSTGAIIYLDGLPRKTFKWSMVGATLILGVSLAGLWASADDATPAGAYCAFASALGVWAWHEMSFYMGYVTGPRRHACAPGCKGWRHFGHAVQVSLWHELAILVSFALIMVATHGEANRTGLWTFVIFWAMHESARLNVVLGVRNVNAHFLPEHLAYLKSFLVKKPMNLLFPVSVTLSTAVFGVIAAEASFSNDAFRQTGLTFVATILALAIIEHWFLVLPIPAERLWEWGMRSRAPDGGDKHDHDHGHAHGHAYGSIHPATGLRPSPIALNHKALGAGAPTIH